MAYKRLTPEEIEAITPFDPPPKLECPQCDGELKAVVNKMETLVLLECDACGLAWYVDLQK